MLSGILWPAGTGSALEALPALMGKAESPLHKLLGNAGAVLPILVAVATIAALLVVGLIVQVAVCWFLSSCFARLPAPYRRQEPALVWLLLIPCVNLVWAFMVLPPLAASYQAYFEAQGRTDVGDCGHALALAYCVGAVLTAAVGWIPIVGLVNCLLGPLLLLVLILFLVKAASLNAQIPAAP